MHDSATIEDSSTEEDLLMLMRLSIHAVLLPFIATSVYGAPPDVNTLVQQMKQVFEPARPSTRKVEITVSGPNGEQIT